MYNTIKYAHVSQIGDMVRRAAFEIQEGVVAGTMGSATVIAKFEEMFDLGFRLGANVKLGATGDYPRGKLNADDEGGLQIAVGLDPDRKTVIVNFGKDLSWLGLNKTTALALAKSLTAQAGQIGAPK